VEDLFSGQAISLWEGKAIIPGILRVVIGKESARGLVFAKLDAEKRDAVLSAWRQGSGKWERIFRFLRITESLAKGFCGLGGATNGAGMRFLQRAMICGASDLNSVNRV